jgi:hypothetical protein
MSEQGETSMSFRASTAEAMAALEEAARRTGMQHLSADAATGIMVFTAGRTVLAFGEKVTAYVQPAAPGTVQVTLSSNLQFGVTFRGSSGGGRERMANALVQLLPPATPSDRP